MVFSCGDSIGKSLAKVPGRIAGSIAGATTDPVNVQMYTNSFQKAFNRNTDVLLQSANNRISSALSTKLGIETLSIVACA